MLHPHIRRDRSTLIRPTMVSGSCVRVLASVHFSTLAFAMDVQTPSKSGIPPDRSLCSVFLIPHSISTPIDNSRPDSTSFSLRLSKAVEHTARTQSCCIALHNYSDKRYVSVYSGVYSIQSHLCSCAALHSDARLSSSALALRHFSTPLDFFRHYPTLFDPIRHFPHLVESCRIRCQSPGTQSFPAQLSI